MRQSSKARFKIIMLLLSPFIAIVLAVVVYREGPWLDKIYLPEGLIEQKDFYLAQRISTLKEKYNIIPDDSDPAYYLYLDGNKYFSTVTFEAYNVGNTIEYLIDLLLWEDKVKGIVLFGPPKGKMIDIDDLAREIIDICNKAFGNEYYIAYWDTHRKDMSLTRPRLVWQADSCVVIFTYTPYDVYQQLKEKYKYPPSGYSLRFAYNMNSINKPKSPYWTREKLCLE